MVDSLISTALNVHVSPLFVEPALEAVTSL